MKRLKSIENDQVQLEVLECDCGYHMGVDATFLDQVGDFETECPSCKTIIQTKLILPENEVWTAEDSKVASAEGWDIFNAGTPEARLEKVDEKEIFKTDPEAWKFVAKHAKQKREPHHKALRILPKKEREEIKKHAENWLDSIKKRAVFAPRPGSSHKR